MSWQNLTEVAAASSAQTETSALTSFKRGIVQAETLTAAPLGPLSWVIYGITLQLTCL